MATISLCMIVKDEEQVLARCLESVKGAVDEIVVVDTGSTDRTREIARGYTARVYDFAWVDDFAAARNFSFSRAKMDYILWLDADDLLLPADREALMELKGTLDADVVMMRYNVAFDEGGNPTFSYYRERLLRRAANFCWEGAVHEAITPAGKVVYSEIAVTHRKQGPRDPGRNLRILERLLAKGEALDPRQRFYYARELFDAGRYREADAAFQAFLDGGDGWVENEIDACRQQALCRRALGDEEGALRSLLRSFCYGAPRAELCCELGRVFFDREDWRTAAFWYELAATRPRDDRSGGFVLPDCYGYIPYLQLCVCHDRLGDRERARSCNELAAALKPEDPAVLHNRAYFAALDGGETS